LIFDLYIILGTSRGTPCWVCQRELSELDFDKVTSRDLGERGGEILVRCSTDQDQTRTTPDQA